MSAGGVVFLIWLVCVAVGVAVHHSPPRRRKRAQRAAVLRLRQEAADRVLARQWLDAVAASSHAVGIRLAHVSYVYGAYPHRGTKAILSWYGGRRQDAWFELAWPRAGQWLLVTGYTGYGPHNDNPNTFYAHIAGVVPAGAFEAWQRQPKPIAS